ncbi:MAG: hypothetical protein WCX84_01865 [Syntrophales bacterium]|nr:hypothetical protein [Syntrophales bacterium]
MNLPKAKPFLGLRKLFHVLVSSIAPLAYWYLPFWIPVMEVRDFVLTVLLFALIVFLVLDATRLLFPPVNRWIMKHFSGLIRETEKKKMTGATYTCLSFLVVVFLFPRDIAVAAMLFLTLGDTAAEIAGNNWGRKRYRGRSLEGMAGFFTAVLPLSWIIFQNGVVAFTGAVVGAWIEFFSVGVDDNLTVPLLSAAGLWCLSYVV